MKKQKESTSGFLIMIGSTPITWYILNCNIALLYQPQKV